MIDIPIAYNDGYVTADAELTPDKDDLTRDTPGGSDSKSSSPNTPSPPTSRPTRSGATSTPTPRWHSRGGCSPSPKPAASTWTETDCHSAAPTTTHIYDEDGECFEYCERCKAKLAQDAAEAKAEWEQWKADGCPVGVEDER